MAQTINLYHGTTSRKDLSVLLRQGNLTIPKSSPENDPRGPGIYFVNSYEAARDQAKGGGSVYEAVIDIEGFMPADDVYMPLSGGAESKDDETPRDALDLERKICTRGRQGERSKCAMLKLDMQRAVERNASNKRIGDDYIPENSLHAESIVNLLLYHNMMTARVSPYLLALLQRYGVSGRLVHLSGKEEMLVLFDLARVVSLKKLPANKATQATYKIVAFASLIRDEIRRRRAVEGMQLDYDVFLAIQGDEQPRRYQWRHGDVPPQFVALIAAIPPGSIEEIPLLAVPETLADAERIAEQFGRERFVIQSLVSWWTTRFVYSEPVRPVLELLKWEHTLGQWCLAAMLEKLLPLLSANALPKGKEILSVFRQWLRRGASEGEGQANRNKILPLGMGNTSRESGFTYSSDAEILLTMTFLLRSARSSVSQFRREESEYIDALREAAWLLAGQNLRYSDAFYATGSKVAEQLRREKNSPTLSKFREAMASLSHAGAEAITTYPLRYRMKDSGSIGTEYSAKFLISGRDRVPWRTE